MATGTATGQSSFDLASPETATIWSDALMLQITNDQHYVLRKEFGLWGEGHNFAINNRKELKANDGGKVHCTLMMSLDHEGRKGRQTMEGHEGGFDTGSMEFQISDWRAGWKLERPLSEKIVAFNVIDNFHQGITEWCWKRDYYIFLAMMAGYTADAGSGWVDHTNRQIDVSGTDKDDIWTRANTIVAPASNYHFRGTAANVRATDEAVVSGDELDLATIHRVGRLIRTARFPLRPPITVRGKPIWPWFIGPKTAETMENNSEITDIWHSLLQGGYIQDNPFFSNAIGAIRNFVFFVLDDMPPGVHSSTNAAVTTVERSFILGCNAMTTAFPRGFNPENRWKYITGTRDGGAVKFMHVYGEGGWVQTRYTDPVTSDDIDFKFVCTHYTS